MSEKLDKNSLRARRTIQMGMGFVGERVVQKMSNDIFAFIFNETLGFNGIFKDLMEYLNEL